MGSSYRSDLKSGGMKAEEAKLREAVRLIREVAYGWGEGVGDGGQFDNAADDGGFIERLYIASRLVEEELPKLQDHKGEPTP